MNSIRWFGLDLSLRKALFTRLNSLFLYKCVTWCSISVLDIDQGHRCFTDIGDDFCKTLESSVWVTVLCKLFHPFLAWLFTNCLHIFLFSSTNVLLGAVLVFLILIKGTDALQTSVMISVKHWRTLFGSLCCVNCFILFWLDFLLIVSVYFCFERSFQRNFQIGVKFVSTTGVSMGRLAFKENDKGYDRSTTVGLKH